jgi:YD repeat-containing protein
VRFQAENVKRRTIYFVIRHSAFNIFPASRQNKKADLHGRKIFLQKRKVFLTLSVNLLKMKRTGIFCLLLLALASCRKDSTTTTNTVENPLIPSANTMLVSSMTTHGYVSRFQYDSSNRLVAETDSGVFDNGTETLSSTFGYDNQGNLTKREISGKDGDTTYNITYVNGQPTSATFVANIIASAITTPHTITGTITYTVANNKVTEIDGAVYPTSQKLKITYSGNNVASIIANGAFDNAVFSYTYGTNKSPFAASAFKWFLFPDFLPQPEELTIFRFGFPVNMYNQNEVDSFSTGGAFTNQYNTLGYPTQIVANGATATYQYIK